MENEQIIETNENLEEDKTSEKNEDVLEGIPDGDEEFSKEDKKEEKKKSSAEVQKAKYREKWATEKAERERLEKLLEESKKEKPPDDEREKAAQEYIRKQAREEYKELLAEQKKEEEKAVKQFQEALDDALEANSDFTESAILDVVEEFESEFSGMQAHSVVKAAVKILQKRSEEKPKMPKPKGGSEKIATKKSDDSQKSMWQIAQETIAEYKTKN